MRTKLQQAFLHQMEENQRLVHKVCKIYTDNPDDHEDLFQEIVLQLWKAFPNYRAEAKFSTWAYKIALNTAITLFRKREKQPKVDADKEILNLHIKSDEVDEESEKIQIMYEAIHQLNDIEKALIMMFLDDKPYKEIAELLSISEGNARIKMMRTRDKLKTLIQHK